MFMQRFAEYTLGLLTLGRKRKALRWSQRKTSLPHSSERTCRTAFICKARDRRVGLLPEWEQRVYLMLDREGQAMTAGQR